VSAPAVSPARRFWPALVCLLVLALLAVVHTAGFGPLAARYRRQLAGAGEMGASLDPSLSAAPLPPRVVELLRRNSLATTDAGRMSESGFLATDLVRRIAETAVECGIDVAGSEPGATTQTVNTLEVRARLHMRGRYDQLVELLDDLAKERTLYRVEQLSLNPLPLGLVEADLVVARVLLKRSAGTQ
jgi:hypothetical protein